MKEWSFARRIFSEIFTKFPTSYGTTGKPMPRYQPLPVVPCIKIATNPWRGFNWKFILMHAN
jgi:hypothetical protein